MFGVVRTGGMVQIILISHRGLMKTIASEREKHARIQITPTTTPATIKAMYDTTRTTATKKQKLG